MCRRIAEGTRWAKCGVREFGRSPHGSVADNHDGPTALPAPSGRRHRGLPVARVRAQPEPRQGLSGRQVQEELWPRHPARRGHGQRRVLPVPSGCRAPRTSLTWTALPGPPRPAPFPLPSSPHRVPALHLRHVAIWTGPARYAHPQLVLFSSHTTRQSCSIIPPVSYHADCYPASHLRYLTNARFGVSRRQRAGCPCVLRALRRAQSRCVMSATSGAEAGGRRWMSEEDRMVHHVCRPWPRAAGTTGAPGLVTRGLRWGPAAAACGADTRWARGGRALSASARSCQSPTPGVRDACTMPVAPPRRETLRAGGAPGWTI